MELSNDTSYALRSPAPEADVVLHCGDLTGDECTIPKLRKAFALLSAIPAELRLVIAGNHDTLLDKDFHTLHGGDAEAHTQARRLGEEYGVTYLEEGTHTFTLKSGATFKVYASPYTPSQYGDQYNLHAFQYASNQDRYNPRDTKGAPTYAINTATETSIVPNDVDIVMTHGPPKYILDRPSDGTSAGCEHLRRAICRTKPLLHCFGHIHASYGAQRVEWRIGHTNSELEDLGIEADLEHADEMLALPAVEPEGRMKNSNRRRGFVRVRGETERALVRGRQTLLVNAAIEVGDGEPRNAPWRVDLELPVRTVLGKRKAGVGAEEGLREALKLRR
ncbi:hypothetical protein M8818_000579 [Zalaria obscura]|uniref:Uncharacterized protein n=1 Tax=Zalaria obscura TaxID=2024903 RepID=A0ACC3SN99_9PEZI